MNNAKRARLYRLALDAVRLCADATMSPWQALVVVNMCASSLDAGDMILARLRREVITMGQERGDLLPSNMEAAP